MLTTRLDESSSEEEEEEEEEEATETATDGLQTPSGLETPSGMQSVMSSIRGGLETPDFLELRKGRAASELSETPLPNRSLYQVLPEKQTAVRGLMGSERGYDVSAVSGAPANVPILGEDRASKVCDTYGSAECGSLTAPFYSARMVWMLQSTHRSWKVCLKINCEPSMKRRREETLAFQALAPVKILVI